MGNRSNNPKSVVPASVHTGFGRESTRAWPAVDSPAAGEPQGTQADRTANPLVEAKAGDREGSSWRLRTRCGMVVRIATNKMRSCTIRDTLFKTRVLPSDIPC